MRHVPELVFINCCHLGNTGAGSAQFNRPRPTRRRVHPHGRARRGVRRLGGDDAAALTFAEAFWSHAGRQRVRRRGAPRAETWSARTWRQHLGRLPVLRRPWLPAGARRHGLTASRAGLLRAPRSWATELDNLTESIGMISRRREATRPPSRKTRASASDALLARARRRAPRWMKRADVCASLGFRPNNTARASCSRRFRVAGPRA